MASMWHCFRYSGPTASITNGMQNDPNHPSPPNVNRAWLDKKMLKAASFNTLDEVEGWVRQQIASVEGQIDNGEVLSSYDAQARAVRAMAESSYDRAGTWSRWISRGTSFVQVAVVGN